MDELDKACIVAARTAQNVWIEDSGVISEALLFCAWGGRTHVAATPGPKSSRHLSTMRSSKQQQPCRGGGGGTVHSKRSKLFEIADQTRVATTR